MIWAPIVVLSLLLAQAQTTPPADPISEAGAHLDAGRYPQAIAILTQLVEKDPKDYAVRFNLALAQALAGHETEAIAEYRRVLELKEDLFEANLNLGQLLVKASRNAEAEPFLRRALELKAKDTRAIYLLARAYLGQKKWGEGLEQLEQAIALSPDDRALKLEYAEACEAAGLAPRAIEAWRRLGDDPAAQERLGLLQLNAGEFEAAITSLEAVMKASPTAASAYALATAYLRNGQPEKSLPLAEFILSKEPENFDALMFYGRILRDQKRYPLAAKQFQTALKIRQDNLEAWREFTSALVLMGQYDTALQALERVKALGGETPSYFYFRAIMLDALKQPKPALESYERFLELSQGSSPDEEFKARQRVRILKRTTNR